MISITIIKYVDITSYKDGTSQTQQKEKTRKLGELTKLFLVNKTKRSLRTTIPITVIKQWDLTEDDYLEWTWQVINGEMVMIVKKANFKKRSLRP